MSSCPVCDLVFCRCPPTPENHQEEVSIFDLVRADLQARDDKGWETYGRMMTANDGRNSLQDAYEEVLDLAMYLRKKIREETGR